MMKVVACLMLVLPCVFTFSQVKVNQAHQPFLMTMIDQDVPMDKVFASFQETHGKKYESEIEETMRQRIFEVNVQSIKEHNVKFARGEKSYYLGVNQFSDLTHQEFLSLYTGHLHKRNPNRNASTFIEPANVACPQTVDWRDKDYVTPVKNQGQCGSCWAFSTTGSLEGQHKAKTGKLISLSEQQLVDCSGTYGNQGCNGGLMDQGFDYIEHTKGIESEEDYPYDAQDETCKYNPEKEKATVSGFVDVESGSESKLKTAVCTKGPVSVAIDASHPSFQSYAGGVYIEEECSSKQLDHGVLVIGYGTSSDQDYWLVKNSWGTSWGIDGYVKMARNMENQCGVATQASYPLV